MSDPRQKRREQDLRKIRELIANYSNLIELINVNPTSSSIKLRINAPTAGSKDYPNIKQSSSDIQIELPSNYPFEGPKITVLTPIWNPNIFANGNICLGTKWIQTEGLDLTVERVIKVITFDAQIINIDSPANGEAKNWYISARAKFPWAFPSIKLSELKRTNSRPAMTWRNIQNTAPTSKVSLSCPNCSAKLKITVSDQTKKIRCPQCSTIFSA